MASSEAEGVGVSSYNTIIINLDAACQISILAVRFCPFLPLIAGDLAMKQFSFSPGGTLVFDFSWESHASDEELTDVAQRGYLCLTQGAGKIVIMLDNTEDGDHATAVISSALTNPDCREVEITQESTELGVVQPISIKLAHSKRPALATGLRSPAGSRV